MASKHPLALALNAAGTQAKLAAVVGVTQQAISLRLKMADPMPVDWALKIESTLKIHRGVLRPDLWPIGKAA